MRGAGGFSPCTWSTRCGCTHKPLFAIAAYTDASWMAVTETPCPIGTLPIVEPDQYDGSRPALSPGKSMPVRFPKPNCAIQCLSRVSPSSVRAIVTVPTFDERCEDLRDGHPLGAAVLRVMDHAIGDLNRIRKRERRVRCHEML